jgi:1-deoxy-D-xylulose-5-phosphate synthase
MGVPLDQIFKTITAGEAEVLMDGEKAAIFAIGSTVYPALEAAEKLESEGTTCSVVNSRFIKPLDVNTLIRFAKKAEAIITVEENILQGGFGSAVLEALHLNNIESKVTCLGIPDVIVEHGPQSLLRAKYGIDSTGIYNAVKKLIDSEQAEFEREKKRASG